jgi:hypothetical protein
LNIDDKPEELTIFVMFEWVREKEPEAEEEEKKHPFPIVTLLYTLRVTSTDPVVDISYGR